MTPNTIPFDMNVKVIQTPSATFSPENDDSDHMINMLRALCEKVDAIWTRLNTNAIGDLQIGQIYRGYELLSLIGQGGFGQLWRAKSEADGEILAVKFLFGQRLQREAAFLRELSDLKITPAHRYSANPDHNHNYSIIAMELVNGVSLDEALPYEFNKRVEVFTDLAISLFSQISKLAVEKIVHGDIKNANILCEANGDVKLIDLGAAVKLDRAEDFVQIKQFTPDFAAPETLNNFKIGLKSDIFSSVKSLYYAWDGKNYPHKLPPRLQKILNCGLVPDTKNRHSARTILKRLHNFKNFKKIKDFPKILFTILIFIAFIVCMLRM